MKIGEKKVILFGYSTDLLPNFVSYYISSTSDFKWIKYQLICILSKKVLKVNLIIKPFLTELYNFLKIIKELWFFLWPRKRIEDIVEWQFTLNNSNFANNIKGYWDSLIFLTFPNYKGERKTIIACGKCKNSFHHSTNHSQ